MIYIFLDIDGVLHSESGDPSEKLSRAPILARVLDRFDPLGSKIAIVISSTWRLDMELARIARELGQSLGRRVCGATPDLDLLDRQRECEAWMADHAPGGKWLAIDDRASWFSEGFDGLLHIEGPYPDWGAGIHEGHAEELSRRLVDLGVTGDAP